MDDQLRDIQDRADCERLVRAFYGRALTDPIIGFIFTDVARLDLEAHVPRITSFWETILFGAQSYAGGAFRPHVALHARVRLRRGHFERWLWLWRTTVDEMFAGERAELAKAHAVRVAAAFHGRLKAMTGRESGGGVDEIDQVYSAESAVVAGGRGTALRVVQSSGARMPGADAA